VHRTVALMWKEFVELRRDPRLFGVVVAAPIIQLLMLGYAATTDIRNVPVVVVDEDRTSASRELIDRMAASPNFSVAYIVSSVNEIDPYLESGRAWMALAIPHDYGRNVLTGVPATVQVIADGSDANSTSVALGYATNLVAGYARDLVSKRIAESGLPAPGGIEARVRVWFNPQLESRDFMLPGILALLLLVVTSILSSMAIVREKELGTLEQLNVTPLNRWELIVGKLVPYGVIGMVDACLVLALTLAWFEVPLRGSLVLVFAMCLVYLLTTLGLGFFVSTISTSQQQAMITVAFFFLMPMIFLSGFIFPIENMPLLFQWVTYAVPLRYFLVILRGIFLKGVGLETLWPQALALAGWGVAILAAAVWRSSKTAG
jgi:ABC-2 type transport system permease protein